MFSMGFVSGELLGLLSTLIPSHIFNCVKQSIILLITRMNLPDKCPFLQSNVLKSVDSDVNELQEGST
ncbi:hypothetical protein ECANGB1_2693 [Enterospora canceri]|uniref:Uncharacterized protein n=1 Tax=Enterospora canceri TaxID=1081671 RepID=A0A1Y1S963_9MICR|nr:hypothetical protein ECANGB1_2693 [Enterospora canceri]